MYTVIRVQENNSMLPARCSSTRLDHHLPGWPFQGGICKVSPCLALADTASFKNIAKVTTGWVHLAEVTSWGHITSSNTNLDRISCSESQLSINFSTRRQTPDVVIVVIVLLWNQNMTQSLTDWQGHLLSCPGQLKRLFIFLKSQIFNKKKFSFF